MNTIIYRKGDATKPAADGKKIIVHICNDMGGWGVGFVLALSRKWNAPEEVYRKNKTKNRLQLGEIQIVKVEYDIDVINMVAQHSFFSAVNPVPLRLHALKQCLTHVAGYAAGEKASVHMPRIGCGLAGGAWKDVSALIEETLCSKDIPVYVYDL
jgi:O-acetyl-ADP-ribose deacetylase (regulator of RNase III)